MTIVHLNAGAGGMYCGSCLLGSTLSRALRQADVAVQVVPLYTPLRLEQPDDELAPVAFGGINVFLQQQAALFRRLPALVDRWLDHPALLRIAGRFAGSTRPERLGRLCVSMLQGEAGRQVKELRKLMARLAAGPRVRLVHLANALLAGLARPLAQALGAPVVSTLAGEDLFLDQLPEPYRAQAWALMRERCAELAGLTAPSAEYADRMAERLDLPRARIVVIRPGLELPQHAGQPPPPGPRNAPGYTVGYLGRIAPEKGLHLLAEAAAILAADTQLPPWRVVAAGSLTAAERPYLKSILRRVSQAGLAARFVYAGEPDRAEKIRLLQSFDILALPSVFAESRGLSLLEGWANGVAAVLPAAGVFPELLADCGGGLAFTPGDPAALAETLRRMLVDPPRMDDCARRAHAAVHARYSAQRMAAEMLHWYEAVEGLGLRA